MGSMWTHIAEAPWVGLNAIHEMIPRWPTRDRRVLLVGLMWERSLAGNADLMRSMMNAKRCST